MLMRSNPSLNSSTLAKEKHKLLPFLQLTSCIPYLSFRKFQRPFNAYFYLPPALCLFNVLQSEYHKSKPQQPLVNEADPKYITRCREYIKYLPHYICSWRPVIVKAVFSVAYLKWAKWKNINVTVLFYKLIFKEFKICAVYAESCHKNKYPRVLGCILAAPITMSGPTENRLWVHFNKAQSNFYHIVLFYGESS